MNKKSPHLQFESTDFFSRHILYYKVVSEGQGVMSERKVSI